MGGVGIGSASLSSSLTMMTARPVGTALKPAARATENIVDFDFLNSGDGGCGGGGGGVGEVGIDLNTYGAGAGAGAGASSTRTPSAHGSMSRLLATGASGALTTDAPFTLTAATATRHMPALAGMRSARAPPPPPPQPSSQMAPRSPGMAAFSTFLPKTPAPDASKRPRGARRNEMVYHVLVSENGSPLAQDTDAAM